MIPMFPASLSSRRRSALLRASLPLLALLSAALPASRLPAQIAVFDPTNYTQNLLQAARALQQINNQIQSLQNQAAMLGNMAKNLSRIDFPELQELGRTLDRINGLMTEAQRLGFRVETLEAEYRRLFPQGFDATMTSDAHAAGAQARMDASVAALRQTLGVQAQVVTNVRADAKLLSTITTRSQGAEGSLQAVQASNQLLALTARQQLQIQTLMAAQFHADAIERARRIRAEGDARAATTKFLGTGSAWTPR